MSTSKLAGAVLTLIITIATIPCEAQSPHRARIDNLKPLNVLVGDWNLATVMMPLNALRVTEQGTMRCISLYDSTYIECNVELANAKGHMRQYKQLITYNPGSSQFEVLYLYSGTPMRVLELGTFKEQTLLTSASLPQPGGVTETIDCSFTVTDRDNLFFESRSSATNGEVDYTCTYSRKK